MLIVHGIGEHSGRYERTGSLLAAAGIDVHAVDLPGQGESEGRRGDIPFWHDFIDAVNDGLARARATRPDLPAVLFGHSMGGLIVLDTVLAAEAQPPDLLVLSAPAVRDAIPRWMHVAAPYAARVVPTRVQANTWHGSALSRDPEVGQRSAADRLCTRGATFRLAAQGFAAQDRVRADLARRTSMPVPTLVFHGEADPLVPVTASEPLGRLGNVDRRTYPDLRHETLNEPEGPAIVTDVTGWLSARVPGASPAVTSAAGSSSVQV